MNNKLVLTVLSVMLSWLSQGIHGQNATNMTTTPPTNTSTTVVMNTTTTPPMNTSTTVVMNTTTTAPMNTTTTPPMNTTTTPPMNTTTTPPMNTTTTPPMNTTTTPPMNTTTTPPMNTTTTAPVNTTMTETTTAGPLVPNITVSDLEMNISRTGCGAGKLCADEPMACTPTAEGCLFFSAMQMSGQNFDLELSGESDGYIAVTLSTDASVGGNDQTFVCANNNSNVQFFGALLNNGMLNVTELNVTSVRGSVTGRLIQCTFAATVPTPDSRVSNVLLAVSTGSFNATSGALGNPNIQIQSGVIDLANPRVNITNMITTTPMTPTTTSMSSTTDNAVTHQLSLTRALLITVGVLTLTRL